MTCAASKRWPSHGSEKIFPAPKNLAIKLMFVRVELSGLGGDINTTRACQAVRRGRA